MCFTGLLSELSSYISVNAEVVMTSTGTWHLIYLHTHTHAHTHTRLGILTLLR